MSKYQTVRRIPESATLAAIPAGTPLLNAKHMSGQVIDGMVYVRVHSKRLGYYQYDRHSPWIFLFIPSDNVMVRV